MALPLAAGLVGVLALGCSRKDPISGYRAPKEPTWRMLAALVPVSEETWTFKVVGLGNHVTPVKDEILKFLRTVEFKESEARWVLPPGWTEEKASGDRRATLRLGSAQPRLELSVVRLPGMAGGVLANVNRWRGQMGFPPLSQAEVARETQSLEIGGAKATLVDLEGPQKPSSPPFAGDRDRASSAPGSGGQESLRELFVFEAPSAWVENPSPAQGRVLEFRAGQASVSLSILADSAGGLLDNVNRWRRQVGLPPVDEAAAKASIQPVAFLGKEGSMADLVGKDRAVECAFLLGPPFSIFLKLDGAPGAVDEERQAFARFLGTLKLKH
jgi:hypothetical protein